MRIFVHIGHYKCGTTALQRRLSSERKSLAAQGIVYPKLERMVDGARPLPNHSALAFEILAQAGGHLPAWYRERRASMRNAPDLETLQDRLREQVEAAAEAGSDVILSSEELMRFGGADDPERLVETLVEPLGDADITAFAHLRRPDAHMPSFYNQLIKMGAVPVNLSQHLKRSIGTVHIDYARALAPWATVLGATNIVVRRYEHRDGDITEDFLSAVGLTPTLAPDSERWDNERFPDLYLETFRRWNNLHPSPELSAALKTAAIELAAGRHAGVTVDLLTPPAREQLHEAFLGIDARLTRVLGRDESLFPDIDEILVPKPDSITDGDAHRRYATELFDHAFAVRAAEPVVEESVAQPVREPTSLPTRVRQFLAQRLRR